VAEDDRLSGLFPRRRTAADTGAAARRSRGHESAGAAGRASSAWLLPDSPARRSARRHIHVSPAIACPALVALADGADQCPPDWELLLRSGVDLDLGPAPAFRGAIAAGARSLRVLRVVGDHRFADPPRLV